MRHGSSDGPPGPDGWPRIATRVALAMNLEAPHKLPHFKGSFKIKIRRFKTLKSSSETKTRKKINTFLSQVPFRNFIVLMLLPCLR